MRKKKEHRCSALFLAWLFFPLLARFATALNLKVAVVVPGFLTASSDFQEMCTELTKAGIPSVTVPLKLWHWIPCLGGRSARPILERIDHTVQHLIANDGDPANIPPYQYSIKNCWDDFWTNPGGIFEVGGSAEVDNYPCVQPQGCFELPDSKLLDAKKIVLVGHSAGGWISRAYLSSRDYGGKSYSGSRFVHTLITLGTPHLDAPGPAFSGIRWVDQEDALVPSLAVGSSGFNSNDWGSFTKGAYQFCGFEDASGDGVTPLESSLGYNGAVKLELSNVHHIDWANTFGGSLVSKELTEDRKLGTPWYGTQEVVQTWTDFLKQGDTTM